LAERSRPEAAWQMQRLNDYLSNGAASPNH
jgi:hypothetical protein